MNEHAGREQEIEARHHECSYLPSAVEICTVCFLLAQLREARETLAAVHDFVEEQYKDGVCLWCGWESGGSLDFHCCAIGALDRILKGGD